MEQAHPPITTPPLLVAAAAARLNALVEAARLAHLLMLEVALVPEVAKVARAARPPKPSRLPLARPLGIPGAARAVRPAHAPLLEASCRSPAVPSPLAPDGPLVTNVEPVVAVRLPAP